MVHTGRALQQPGDSSNDLLTAARSFVVKMRRTTRNTAWPSKLPPPRRAHHTMTGATPQLPVAQHGYAFERR